MNLYSTAQAAEQLDTTTRTVQRWCKREGIGTRVGRDLVLSSDDVDRLRLLVYRDKGNPRLRDSEVASELGRRGGEAKWRDHETA